MGVAVLELALGEERAGGGQRLDDADVGGAFLARRADDVLAAEEGEVGR
jgi:hypothetical protein